MSSGCDHYECAACYSMTRRRETAFVCIDTNRKPHLVRTVCPSCTHTLCNWLLSLPNRKAENTSVSVRVSCDKELVDTPITRSDLDTLKRWLHIER